jgi:hypothetical protein
MIIMIIIIIKIVIMCVNLPLYIIFVWVNLSAWTKKSQWRCPSHGKLQTQQWLSPVATLVEPFLTEKQGLVRKQLWPCFSFQKISQSARLNRQWPIHEEMKENDVICC